MEHAMKKIIAATAFAAMFAAVPAIAAESGPNVDPGLNTGKQGATPSDNSAGVKGAPGNKNGPATGSNGSAGASTGEQGMAPSQNAAGVKGAQDSTNGPSDKKPGDTSK
jgi:hypothetical protein